MPFSSVLGLLYCRGNYQALFHLFSIYILLAQKFKKNVYIHTFAFFPFRLQIALQTALLKVHKFANQKTQLGVLGRECE